MQRRARSIVGAEVRAVHTVNSVFLIRRFLVVGTSGGWSGPAQETAPRMMLVHHADGEHEYAYGPAGGLPGTGIGVFPDAPLQDAIDRSWFVIDMKTDWKSTLREGWSRPVKNVTRLSR